MVWLVVRFRDRAHARVGYTGYQTPWWRLRFCGARGAPFSAGALMMFSWSLGAACIAVFQWTAVETFGALGVVVALGGTAYYFVEYGISLFTDKYDDVP